MGLLKMSSQETYLIDTNIFIQSKNFEYQFHFCPGFWNWIESINGTDNFISIENVYDEILSANDKDELVSWVKKRKSQFVSFDSNSQKVFQAMENCFIAKNIDQAKKEDFYNVADSYLVAYAKTHNCTIVTHEKLAPNGLLIRKGKIQLPSVCDLLNVHYLSIYDLMKKEQNKRLVLQNI